MAIIKPLIIHKPIWHGGERKVGIAEYKLCNDNYIVIDYRTKDTQLLYPHLYVITRDEIVKANYPRQVVRGVRMVIIPIDDLRVVEEGGAEKYA